MQHPDRRLSGGGSGRYVAFGGNGHQRQCQHHHARPAKHGDPSGLGPGGGQLERFLHRARRGGRYPPAIARQRHPQPRDRGDDQPHPRVADGKRAGPCRQSQRHPDRARGQDQHRRRFRRLDAGHHGRGFSSGPPELSRARCLGRGGEQGRDHGRSWRLCRADRRTDRQFRHDHRASGQDRVGRR